MFLFNKERIAYEQVIADLQFRLIELGYKHRDLCHELETTKKQSYEERSQLVNELTISEQVIRQYRIADNDKKYVARQAIDAKISAAEAKLDAAFNSGQPIEQQIMYIKYLKTKV